LKGEIREAREKWKRRVREGCKEKQERKKVKWERTQF